MGIGELWDQLVDCICRPPRDDGFCVEDLVGGLSGRFRAMSAEGYREDLVIPNKTGHKLQCSHYIPKHAKGKDGRLPCVVYCHCNSGSRRDAEEAVLVLIPLGVSVFTLDFMGSGLSEGSWVSLGCTEVEDVDVVIQHLRSTNKVSTIALWGRSMGAVTALMYSQRDPSIAGVVLDSPFSRLTDLILEIVEDQKLPIPRPLCKIAVAAMRRSVRKRANFDIQSVAPIDVVGGSFIPALFGHATGDTFIRIAHSEKLHAAYAGDKNLIKFDGDHNSRRPSFFYDSVAIFLHNTMQLENLLVRRPSAAAGSSSGGGGVPRLPLASDASGSLLDLATTPGGTKRLPGDASLRRGSFVSATSPSLAPQRLLHLNVTPVLDASDTEAGRIKHEEVSSIDRAAILSHLTPRGNGRVSRDDEEQQLAEAMRRSLLELQSTIDANSSQSSLTSAASRPSISAADGTASGTAAVATCAPAAPAATATLADSGKLSAAPTASSVASSVAERRGSISVPPGERHHLVPRTSAEEEELLRLTLALSVQEANLRSSSGDGVSKPAAGQVSAGQVPHPASTSGNGGSSGGAVAGAAAGRLSSAGQVSAVRGTFGSPPAPGYPADAMMQSNGKAAVAGGGDGGTCVPLSTSNSSISSFGNGGSPTATTGVPPKRPASAASSVRPPAPPVVAGSSWCSWCSSDGVIPPVHKSGISGVSSSGTSASQPSMSVSGRSAGRVSLPSGVGAGETVTPPAATAGAPDPLPRTCSFPATAAAAASGSRNGPTHVSNLGAAAGRASASSAGGAGDAAAAGGTGRTVPAVQPLRTRSSNNMATSVPA